MVLDAGLRCRTLKQKGPGSPGLFYAFTLSERFGQNGAECFFKMLSNLNKPAIRLH